MMRKDSPKAQNRIPNHLGKGLLDGGKLQNTRAYVKFAEGANLPHDI